MDAIEYIDKIEVAIKYLKNHEILFTNHLNNKTFFVEKKEKVLVIGTNSKFFLSYNEFKDLYKEAKFVIYEEKDDSFDFTRDVEYYNWKHK